MYMFVSRNPITVIYIHDVRELRLYNVVDIYCLYTTSTIKM